jgi:hypothetical protein
VRRGRRRDALDRDLHRDPLRTRVELVHAGFEAYGDRTAEMVDSYGADDGWTAVLARFVDATR